eukprot:1777697-Rhodomonas_salina.2
MSARSPPSPLTLEERGVVSEVCVCHHHAGPVPALRGELHPSSHPPPRAQAPTCALPRSPHGSAQAR